MQSGSNGVRDYYQAMAPYSEPGGYINFMQDDDYGKIQVNYTAQNYDRLVQVKRKYDPNNLFHINQNITPLRSLRPRGSPASRLVQQR